MDKLFNHTRALKIMDEDGLEALVASSATNVSYTSGYSGFCAVIPRDTTKGAALVTSIQSFRRMPRDCSWIEDIRAYERYWLAAPPGMELPREDRKLLEMREKAPHYDEPLDGLVAVLKEKGLSRARIGLEETNISYLQMETLREALPQAEFIPAHEIFYRIRMVKTEEELRRIKVATLVNEEAARKVVEMLKPGVTPNQANQRYREFILLEAPRGTGLGWFSVSAGHVYAGDANRPMEMGNPWMLEFGTPYQGYYSDSGRTGSLGEPSTKQRHDYSCIRAGYLKALSMMRPGVWASAIFTAAVEAVRQAGLPHYRRHLVGHSEGYENHEPPVIGTPQSHYGLIDYPLEAGMILVLEFPYYELGTPGMQLEDTVLITEDGYEMLSDLPRDIIQV